VRGQATDIEIQAREILRMKAKLNELIVKHTGQSIERVEKDTDRDYFMGATEAKAYGIIDEIQSPRKIVGLGKEEKK
jgi:ATP-dependent Clp protease, protease subunit